ncbi:hypothetical protein GW17_00026685, partial [Ensete ventricosum]
EIRQDDRARGRTRGARTEADGLRPTARASCGEGSDSTPHGGCRYALRWRAVFGGSAEMSDVHTSLSDANLICRGSNPSRQKGYG